MTATYAIDHTYTEDDLTRIRQIIMGNITPTPEDYMLYDVNGDGRISALDYVRVKNAAESLSGKITSTIVINPRSYGAMISIYTNFGTETRIGGGGLEVPMLSANNIYVTQLLEAPRATIAGDAYGNYVLTVNGSGYATGSFVNGSKEELKTDIKPIDFNVFDVINNTDIYEFKYKADIESGVNNVMYGAVIGDKYKCDSHIITADGGAISTYSMTSILWEAVKELKNEVSVLKEKIDKLEKTTTKGE